VLDEIAAEMAGIVKIAMVNAMAEQSLALQHNISGVPALHLYRGGSKIKETAGAMPKAQLTQWIRSSL
jgi:thioredoxin 1